MPILVTNSGEIQFLQNGVDSAFTAVGLYSLPVARDPLLTLAGLQIADFSGYDGEHDITWMAAFINALGKGQRLAPSTQWVSADPCTVTNMIYGAYYVDSFAHLSAIYPFDTPVNINAPFIPIVFQPSLTCQSPP